MNFAGGSAVDKNVRKRGKVPLGLSFCPPQKKKRPNLGTKGHLTRCKITVTEILFSEILVQKVSFSLSHRPKRHSKPKFHKPKGAKIGFAAAQPSISSDSG
jgi:hypothetical protein